MGTAARIPDTQQTLEKTSLYRRDYYTWARQQVAALKRRDFDAIDWENVTEEMQALVTSQESSLRSQYARVMEHFLKLQYRDARETEPLAGWRISIDNARMEIEALLQDSPGLQSRCEDLFHDAWRRARRRVINAFAHEAAAGNPNDSAFLRERKRLTREWSRALPQDNPYNRQQVEDPDWMPERARLSQRPQSRQQSTPKIDWDR
jgi:hypothetical protein